MAFLEVEKQNQEENANRQYTDFIQYYEKAKDLCADTPEGSQDVEMQLLDSLYVPLFARQRKKLEKAIQEEYTSCMAFGFITILTCRLNKHLRCFAGHHSRSCC